MIVNGQASKRWVVGLVIGFSIFIAAGPARCASESSPSYQLADVLGQWSWAQDPWFGDFTIEQDGDTGVGALNDVYEGTYGDRMEDIAIFDNHIYLTRNGRYGLQYWEGNLKEEEGVLKIIDGVWLKPAGDTGPFRAEKIYFTPVNAGAKVNSNSDESSPDISADGMSLYLEASGGRSGSGGLDIWMSRASTPHQDFAAAGVLPKPVNSKYDECGPCISDDGLSLYFASNRPGGSGDFDIWMTTRTTPADAWGEPVNLGPTVNGVFADNHPSISGDGLALYFDSRRPDGDGAFNGSDIWVCRRADVNDPWGPAEPVWAINTPENEFSPDVSSDGLTLYYDSPQAQRDLWVTHRTDPNEFWSWEAGTHLGVPYSSGSIDTDPSLASDGSKLYFVSDRLGGRGSLDIWVVDMKKKQE
jgi:hypothetical protein